MSKNRQEGSFASQVMDLAAARNIVRRVDICESLGCDGKKADGALKELVMRKAIVRIARGVYQYAGAPRAAPEAEMEERIWRAMKINPTWSAGDVAMQAGTTAAYVYKKIRWFHAEGLIQRAGVRPILTGGSEKLWRITMKGRERSGRPAPLEYKPDPLVVDVVALNRLICTGLAQRFDAQRAEALGICRRIVEGLEGEGSGEGGSYR